MSNVQRIVGDYKIKKYDSGVNLERLSENFLEVMRYDGNGNLYSMFAEFNNTKVLLKVIIDETEIFELDLDKLKNQGSTDMQYDHFAVFSESSQDTFKFKPSFPILFRKSISVMAKANSNSSSRDFEYGMIELSEE